MKIALRAVVIFALFSILIMVVVRWNQTPGKTMRPPVVTTTVAEGVKARIPIDLTGEWKSTDEAKPKIVARITANTIEMDFVDDSVLVSYWRGSFEVPKSGQSGITSKATNAEFSLSTAPTKDFVIQDDKLIFQLSAMGVTKIVEMKRAG